MMTTREILINANKYKTFASLLTTEQKNKALCAMADELISSAPAILAATLKTWRRRRAAFPK